MKIFKYRIPFQDVEVKIPLSEGCQVLHVGEQNNEVFIWIAVDPDQIWTCHKRFRIIGTGYEIKVDDYYQLKFIGTVQMKNGLVWHVFENVGEE